MSSKRQLKKIDMSKKPGKNSNIADWGNFLVESLKTVNDNMESLATATSTACDQASDALKGIKDVKKTVDSLSGSLQRLSDENTRLNDQNKSLQERLVKLECHQRRNNLIFEGIKEEKGETSEKCEQKVLDALSSIPGLPQDIKISRCHRVGSFQSDRTRQIVCHIHWYKIKTKILKGKKHLPDGIYVQEDFPVEIVERRKVLRPILKAALQHDDYKDNAYLSVDKLIINKKIYTYAPVNNLDSLPDDLNPRSLCEQSDDDTHVFFGIGSPMSNFHKCDFVVDNLKYCCSEQYIQSEKAALFNDDVAQMKIMSTDSPYHMKQIGNRLSNFNKTRWEKKARQVAKKAVTAKFEQNPKLLEVLLSTGTKRLAEASKEKPWGCGISLRENGVLDSSTWNGVGIMGSVLSEVRELLNSKRKK